MATNTEQIDDFSERISGLRPDVSLSVNEAELEGFYSFEPLSGGVMAWLGPNHEGHVRLKCAAQAGVVFRLHVVDFVHDAIFFGGRVAVEGCSVPIKRVVDGERSGAWLGRLQRTPLDPSVLSITIRVPLLYSLELNSPGLARRKVSLALSRIDIWSGLSPQESHHA